MPSRLRETRVVGSHFAIRVRRDESLTRPPVSASPAAHCGAHHEPRSGHEGRAEQTRPRDEVVEDERQEEDAGHDERTDGETDRGPAATAPVDRTPRRQAGAYVG